MRRTALRSVLLHALLTGQCMLPIVALAAAAEDDSNGIPEVVVTATRREERLQDVPISVTAFSQEKMDAQGLRGIDDLTRLSPGVNFERNGASQNYNDESSDISIRGIDSFAGTSTTGVYINDTPIQSRHIGFGAVNAFPELFDLDRVEVLRGPQGTLFGAGAEGGVVRFITPTPSLTTDSAYVRSEIAHTDKGGQSYEESAAFGGPIINDVLGFRVSASYRKDGGWVDRVAYTRDTDAPATDATTPPTYASTIARDSNWSRTMSFRGELKWQVTDTLTISPSLYYQELHINDTGSYWPNLSNPSDQVFRNGNQLPNPSTDPLALAAIKAEWDLGFAQLTSNSSYYWRNQKSVSDYTQYLRASFLGNTYPTSPLDAGTAPFNDKQTNIYQEVRLASKDLSSRLTWNAGIFYAHMKENVGETISDPNIDGEFYALAGYPLCTGYLGYPCPGGLLYTGTDDGVTDKQIALFGEATVEVIDKLKVTVGLRASKVDYYGHTTTGGAFTGGPAETFDGSGSEKPITPKGVITYQPDHDDLYYISGTKGYRVGGINVGVGSICGNDLATIGVPLAADGTRHVPESYSSDHLWSYELGAKNTLFDHKLQIDTSLFWINWSNIQQNVYLPTCGEEFVGNLGKVTSRGGDIDVQYRPLEPLTLAMTAAYVDARYTKASCAGALTFNGTDCDGSATIVREGDRLPSAKWSFTSSAEYVLPIWADYKPYVRGDFQYSTAQTALLPGQDPNNGLNDTTIPGLPINKNLNLRAGLRFNGIDVSMFCNNATNAHPQLFLSRDIAADFDPQYYAHGVRPLTVGLTGTYRY